MAIDSLLPVRRAVLTHLKAQAAVTALVPAASIHPQAPKGDLAWPFVRWGSPSGVPRRAACMDGQDIACALHAFSKGRWTGKRLVETAEDHAARIGAALAAAIDRQRLTIAGGTASILVTGSQLMQDRDEADAFHCVIQLRVRCTTA